MGQTWLHVVLTLYIGLVNVGHEVMKILNWVQRRHGGVGGAKREAVRRCLVDVKWLPNDDSVGLGQGISIAYYYFPFFSER